VRKEKISRPANREIEERKNEAQVFSGGKRGGSILPQGRKRRGLEARRQGIHKRKEGLMLRREQVSVLTTI